MKRKLITLAAGVALIAGLVSGCGASASGEDEKVIRVGAGITPHADTNSPSPKKGASNASASATKN